MPKNPSEMQRHLEEELCYLQRKMSLSHNKSEKSCILSRIRILEDQLGIESKPYNKS